MIAKTVEVNTVRVPARLDPRTANAARILIITQHWLSGAYGIDTGAKAAAIAGCALPTIDAARVVLQNDDQALLVQVLTGQISLSAAAAKARRRVRLIESFKAASADDRLALGRSVGVVELFDSAIAPLVDDLMIDQYDQDHHQTQQPTNGTGTRPYVPAAPPVVVRVNAH